MYVASEILRELAGDGAHNRVPLDFVLDMRWNRGFQDFCGKPQADSHGAPTASSPYFT